jgi:MFS family permease
MAKAARWHYAGIIVVVTFLTLLASSGVRTVPGVIIKPLEGEFGWDRGSISLAVAISLFAYGFGGPVGGTLIDRSGPRRIMTAGLALVAVGLWLMLRITDVWQLHVLWGLIVGVGTGIVANVLGATIANRWFNKYRGLIMGLFGAAAAAGQLVFLPWMVTLNAALGWRATIQTLAIVAASLIIPVAILMRDRPQDVNTRAVGDDGSPASAPPAQEMRSTSLADAIRTRDFWLLAGSFFVCGYTTNGLITTHLIPHTLEHGFDQVATAGAIGTMGMMNIIGTLASGWLSDRYDNRKLLAMYYGFRGISLAALPFIVEMRGLFIFAIIYGLDWVATVPPTVNLTAMRFGRGSLGTLYGWIFCSHMIGAGIAAYAGGFFRNILGDYHLIFISAAIMGAIAVGLSMSISVGKRPAPVLAQPQPQAQPAELG